MRADWVFTNGVVYTVDASRSTADAIAVAGSRIVYVGDSAGADAFAGPDTEVIDLDGKMVLPGFVDSHSHPSGALVEAVAVYLYGGTSLGQYLDVLREYVNAHPDKDAIRGAGWSNTLFPPTGPRKEDLDAVAPEKPVFLESEDGHSSWVNSKALELAGIDRDTPDPPGGIIERDPDSGEPSGALRESASALVDDVLPPYSVEERITGLRAFQDMAARDGVTMVRDAFLGVGDDTIAAYRGLVSDGGMTVRFRANLLFDPDMTVERMPDFVAERAKYQSPGFTVDAIKLFIDGVVEGETAYLLEPYAHRPDYRGELLWEPEHLNDVVAAFDREDFIVHVHAIGDGAVRVALDAFERARDVNGPRDARHQMTHIQLVSPEDIQRFAALDVIGVPQPFWFTKGPYYDNLEAPFLGEERASKEYPMQSFIAAGVTMASASDFPVTIPFSPLEGIEYGVVRSADPDDPELVLGPEERASLDDMIASFTIHGAFASFLEDETGSLEVGKLADLVVVDRNLFEIPAGDIGETNVLLTLFEGEPVFRAEGF